MSPRAVDISSREILDTQFSSDERSVENPHFWQHRPEVGHPERSELETHGQNYCGIGPANIEDVRSEVQFPVSEACEKTSLDIERRLISAGSLRGQPKAKPVGRRVG